MRRAKRAFDAWVAPIAWWLGWLGMAGLVACGVLSQLPVADWPGFLSPARLPLYTVGALLLASLLGWTFVAIGQVRIRRRIGRRASVLLLVVLPILCGLIMLPTLYLKFDVLAWLGMPGTNHPAAVFVRWYPPLLVVTCLIAFLAQMATEGRGAINPWRLAWFSALVTPYAVILAYLVFNLQLGWEGDPLLRSLASSGIAVQIALGYFLRGYDVKL